jgi:bacterioferritin-associated ferredoxin
MATPRYCGRAEQGTRGAKKYGMIICSCTILTSEEIHEAVGALRTKDPFVVLTPGLIYKTLGKQPKCGDCMPLVVRLIVGYDEEGPSSAASLPHRSPFDDTPPAD